MGECIPSSPEQLLREWRRRLRWNCAIHYEAAKPLLRGNVLLGIPVVIFTTLAGLTVFASIGTSLYPWWKVAVGIVSIAAAALASLQTFLKLAERAETHRSTAVRCAVIIRKIEGLLVLQSKGREITEADLDLIRSEYDEMSSQAPKTTTKLLRKAREIIAAEDRRREGAPPNTGYS